MPYSIELLPDEPILIATIYESFNLEHDAESFNSDLISTLDGLGKPVYYINDIRAMQVNSFQDFLVAVNKSFREEGAVVRHPNMKQMMVISTSELIKLSAKGMESDAFGNLTLQLFDTLEEALAHARTLIEHNRA